MARPSKLEVSAVNIRIPSDRNRNYTDLLAHLAGLKRGIKVFGSTFIAITHFDADTNEGVISKYSEIDIDGDWFDTDDFGVATPDQLEDLQIPENLRPNYAPFYFRLDPDLHTVAFETYSDSKSLSARSVELYFRGILRDKSVEETYGYVEADTVKSYNEVERILALEQLKELRIIIRRPNPDDLSGNLAAEIEERLRQQNGEEYEEAIRSKDSDGLKPNDRTQKLSLVAAENGQIRAKSIVNGVLVEHDTKELPLKEVETFNKDEKNPRGVFLRLAETILEKIKRTREAGQQA